MQRRPGQEGPRMPQGLKRPVEDRGKFSPAPPQRQMGGMSPRAGGGAPPQVRQGQGRPLPPQRGPQEDEEVLYTHPFAEEEFEDNEYGAYMAAAAPKKPQQPKPQALPRDPRADGRMGAMPIPPAKRRTQRNIPMGLTVVLLIMCAVILFLLQTGLLSR